MMVNSVLAQLPNKASYDSISEKSYDYLKSRFEETITDKGKSKVYASAWLQKARSEKDNYLQLALAYRASAIFVNKPQQLCYIDSMIVNATKAGSNELIGTSYMTMGILYYNHNEHSKALDNYLVADRYIAQSGIPLLKFQVKYGIAQIKYYLGFYDEAIALFKECITFFEEENDRAYLNSLHGLGLCYTRIGKFELAAETNRIGLQEGRLFGVTDMELYFNQSQGINQYYLGNYPESIKLLKVSLPQITQLRDYANEALTSFYIGESNWSLKRYDVAIPYFKNVDRIFQKEKYMLPDLRKGYERLIDYYKQKDDTKLHLYYIHQLLKVDKVLAPDYKYLLKKIVKEYDTKELLNAKKAIENRMVFTWIAACIIALVLTSIIIYLVRKNRRNQKLFDELMNRNTGLPEEKIDDPSTTEEAKDILQIDNVEIEDLDSGKVPAPDISPEIEAAILKKLEKFELTKKYLERDMTLSKMATILHTNQKYVTKIIAKHRGKGTIEYITELKLDYIVEMLKTDSRYRNYTHKALGDEAGFRTTQSFTRAFKSHTGITPTYFSYKLKKSINTDSSL